jgi:hypothetical protein
MAKYIYRFSRGDTVAAIIFSRDDAIGIEFYHCVKRFSHYMMLRMIFIGRHKEAKKISIASQLLTYA